jgi:Raf kinase inhibitor-like YbhB/YbcL family protein
MRILSRRAVIRSVYLTLILLFSAPIYWAGGGQEAAEFQDNCPKASQPSLQLVGDTKVAFQLTSSAFTQGHPIPKKYTGEGEDVSPPLAWTGMPENAKELALICDDPDAPTSEPWVHWVIYKISPKTTGLPEGIPRRSSLKEPSGALQGKNSWPEAEATGYRGPMPPKGHGVHHYYFKLYALDTEIKAEPGLTKKAILEKIRPHVLGECVLMGIYERR